MNLHVWERTEARTSEPANMLAPARDKEARMKRWMLLVLSMVVFLSTVVATSAPEDAEARRRPRCRGERATLVGTKGPDLILGDSRHDVVVARGGNDTIATGKGNDLICGGGGDDIIDGNKGKDPSWGGGGRDVCTASKRREHRLHHQCEAHQGSPGGGTVPSRSVLKAPGPVAPKRDEFVIGWQLPPVERKDDYCVGPYCEYFSASAVRTLGYGYPSCNPFTNWVDFMRVNVAAGVEYAVRAWFQYWDGQRWVNAPRDPGFISGDTLDATGPGAFEYLAYPGFTSNEQEAFVVWYVGWLKNPQTGLWHGPTWTTHSGYLLTGPWDGARPSTFCVTADPPNQTVITYN
jgi:hypothetical protein